MSTGAGGGTSASFNTSFSDISSGLFGTDTSGTGTSEQLLKKKGKTTEKLVLDEAGITAIIEDLLGGTQGLSKVFSEENVSGLFNTSVAKQEAGNLISQIAGELAKLTGTKVTETAGEEEQTGTTTQAQESEGLLGFITEPLQGGVAGKVLGGLSLGGFGF